MSKSDRRANPPGGDGGPGGPQTPGGSRSTGGSQVPGGSQIPSGTQTPTGPQSPSGPQSPAGSRSPGRPRLRRALKITGLSLAGLLALLTALVYWLAGFWLWPTEGLWARHLASTFSDREPGEVVFYGASNFRLWSDLETDLAPYRVQNHGIGGSTDQDLIEYADRLLYPFEPSVVFIQTGSNEYVLGLSVEQVERNKIDMYQQFRDRLPDTTFVVMSGLPLPGRAEHWDQIQEVNAFLAEYCADHERMVFIDATAWLTTPEGDFRPELFRFDGVHLNAAGQKIWAQPMLRVLADLDAPR
ncbi:MAG: GDSL-type esterase/lipase family protein [Propionibacteriaceae bacterium]|jgi:lysophospholipase L1-like esterase|nr:GDSL-type esterase/lipase family protein [Propionibacteriaceae bacterium]